MTYAVVCVVALLASGLTLFSGFGLGTLLMPAFALFFPLDAAVAMTAVVHLANNLFKLALLGRRADRVVVLRFGLPALAASFLGARALVWLSGLPALAGYELLGRTFHVAPVKLAVAVLMLAMIPLEGAESRVQAGPRWLPVGGLLSGFLGGLSGHQGALRSVFLIRAGLSKEGFIATGVVIACMVDAARLGVYGTHVARAGAGGNAFLLAAATASAFLGAWLGSRWLEKVTLAGVRRLVAALLALIALGLGAGIL